MNSQPCPHPSPPGPARTIREIFDWHRANEIRNLSAIAQTERHRLQNLFCAFEDGDGPYGDRPCNEFKPFHLLRFIKSQEGVRSSWTRKRVAVSINAPMNAAMRLGFIERNPFMGLRLPMGKSGRDWRDAEYQATLRSSGAWFRRLVVFIRFSGARPGEARILEWRHFNPLTRLITLQEHKTAAATGESRKIRLNHVAMKLLLWMKRHQVTPSSFVFLNHYGRPWTIGALTKHLRMVKRRAGLPRDLKLHGGRHTFATRGLTNGLDLATVSMLLGHRSVATTEGTSTWLTSPSSSVGR